MENLMAGMALAILAFLVFQIAGMFSRYPARNDSEPPRAFFWMRFFSYFLFAASFFVLAAGFM